MWGLYGELLGRTNKEDYNREDYDDNVSDGMRLWAGRDGLIGRSWEAAGRWITTL